MKLLLINPNTSAPMTHAIAQGAKAVAAPTTEIVAVQPSFGPLSIEGHYDEAFAAAGVGILVWKPREKSRGPPC
jgi:allantoin racemase